MEDRGLSRLFYAIFQLDNGGYRFEVMSKSYVDTYAARYSKSYDADFSPWKSNYEGMAKKTVIKQLLKYASMKSEFQKAISMDETIKTELSIDMSAVSNQEVIDGEFTEQAAYENKEVHCTVLEKKDLVRVVYCKRGVNGRKGTEAQKG